MTRQKAARKAHARRGFGRIEQRGSGRWRAAYTGPDKRLYRAPATFAAKVDAEGWLAQEKRLIDLGTWQPPILREVQAEAETTRQGAVTFRDYAATWAAHRNVKPRTRAGYRGLLERKLLPTFGQMPVAAITPFKVKEWHTEMGTATPTLRAHAYSLLRTILGEAVRDGLIASNPCHIRGAGNSKRVHKIKPASLAELEAITDAMPERYRLMVLLAAWCGLRFGELSELRRSDIDTTKRVIHVRRGVVRVDPDHVPDPLPTGFEFCGCRPGCLIGPPKTEAGSRDVAIPPHLIAMVKDHLASNISGGRDGLLFPASDGRSHLGPSSLYKVFYPARAKAGRPDLRFHDLRHTGAVLAASTGATLAELMARLGHSTPGAAMRYQHASEDRDQVIAAALSALVVPPKARRPRRTRTTAVAK